MAATERVITSGKSSISNIDIYIGAVFNKPGTKMENVKLLFYVIVAVSVVHKHSSTTLILEIVHIKK